LEVPVNDGTNPGRDESTTTQSPKSDRKLWLIGLGFVVALVLLVALNMN
jgi:hypothetical protein